MHVHQKNANGPTLTDNESAQQPFRNVERINTKIHFRRYLDLRTLNGSKLTKRANQPGMHGRVAKPGVQPACKSSACKDKQQGIEIAPASEFHEFRSLNPSPASIFWKNS